MLSFLISQGASSTKCEWIDFFQLSPDTPSASAMNQRRSQLLPSAYEAVFHNFTLSAQNIDSQNSSEQYRYIAADGSDISFFSSSYFLSMAFGKGFVGFVLAAVTLYATQFFVSGYSISIMAAIIGALIYGVIDYIIPGEQSM